MALTEEEINMIKSQDQASGSAAPAQVAGSSGLSMDEIQMINEADLAFTDELTGQQKHYKATGIDPDSALNRRVLTSADRVKLELGNEIGAIKYLQNDPRFEDATINKEGLLTVKQAGKWYLADPKIDPEMGAWELTREILDDSIADATYEAILMGGATAGAAAGGLGGAVAGAAFGEYLRTSLGRSVGTYGATPLEQMRDIALESAFESIPMVKHLPGVKPTAQMAVKALSKTAEALKTPAKAGANALWDFYGSIATSPEVTRTFREVPEEVIGVTKRNSKAFQLPNEFISKVTQEKINLVSEMSNEAETYLKRAYTGLRDKVVAKVPDNFMGNSNMYAANAYAQFLDSNVSKLVKPVKGGGKEIVTDPQEYARMTKWIKENKRMPKGWEVQFKSQEDLLQLVNSGLPVDNAIRKAAVNEDAYKAIKEAHDTFAAFSGRPAFRVRGDQVLAGRGKGEASRLLEDKKNLSSLLWATENNQALSSMGDVQGYIGGLRKQMDSITADHLDQYGAKQLYVDMNKTYSTYKDELMPFIAANKSAKKRGNAVYETLMNQLAQKEGKQEVRKHTLDNVVKLADQLGDKKAIEYFSSFDKQLKARDAAIALNPYVTKRSAGMLIGSYAAFSLNWALGGAMMFGGAVTSPAVQQSVLRTNHAMFEGLKQLKSMSKAQLEFLQRNPQAATAIVRGIQDAKETYSDVKSVFESQFPQTPMQGPGDQ